MKNPKIIKQLGIVILLPLLVLLGNLVILNTTEPLPVQAASIADNRGETFDYAGLQGEVCDCSGDVTLSCINFASRQEAQACYDHCQETVGSDVHGLDSDGDQRACESRPNDPTYGQTEAVTQTEESVPPPPSGDQTSPEPIPAPEETPPPINLVANGDFEFGFYQVPQLGFEARDSGNVPLGWDWYKNQAYGKYTINNNQTFGIECPSNIFGVPTPKEDNNSQFGPIPDFTPSPTFNALTFEMQSSDQQDARLGVYQTVNVVSGVEYRFAMSGTIQVQAGGRTEDLVEPDGEVVVQAPNHTFELFLDQTGGTDWRAIPHEKWTILPIREQKLYFTPEEVEKKGEQALTEVESYKTTFTAHSDKITIFLTAWRKWANWRTGIFTVDCVSLVPVDELAVVTQPAAAVEIPSPADTAPSGDAQPAAITEPGNTEAQTPAGEAPATIPPSGGILEDSGNSILVVIASAIVILGLVAAGIWNMRR